MVKLQWGLGHALMFLFLEIKLRINDFAKIIWYFFSVKHFRNIVRVKFKLQPFKGQRVIKIIFGSVNKMVLIYSV